MTYLEWVQWTEGIQNVFAAAGILAAGAWAFFRFVLQKEGHAKLEMNLDCQAFRSRSTGYLVEIIVFVENKGVVRQELPTFKISLFYLPYDADLTKPHDSGQVLFERALVDKDIVPNWWEWTFVDSGVKQRYSFVTWLPMDARYILAHAKFQYDDSTKFVKRVRKFLRSLRVRRYEKKTSLADATNDDSKRPPSAESELVFHTAQRVFDVFTLLNPPSAPSGPS